MKTPEKELKRHHESPRDQSRVGLILILVVVGIAVAFLLAFDPFDWLDGTPKARAAKNLIVVATFGLIVIGPAGLWAMVINPLRTGIAYHYRRTGPTTMIRRSEQPAAFHGQITYNSFLVLATFVLFTYVLISSIKDLQKAKAEALQPVAANLPLPL